MEKRPKNACCDNARRVAKYAPQFQPGHWSFLGLGDEDMWYGSLINKLNENELNGEEFDTRIRQEWALCIQVLISIVERRAQT